jgi:hypothetical protein
MKRREVFASLGASALGLLGVPAWANGWSPSNIKKDKLSLTENDESLLENICETILPETQTPGAKSLEISKFVKTMVSDIFSKEDQEKFKKGFPKINPIAKLIYGKNYEECTTPQKEHLLNGLSISSDADQKWFFDTLKRLSILGYTTSEYYLTEIAKFEFAPGRYHGCVPLTQ